MSGFPYKLGRKAIKTDTRTLRLARYFTADLPPAPPSVDWSKGIAGWGMLDNDTLGDCTCAGVGHAVQVWSANASTEANVTDAEVLDIYERWCGYNPSDPSTDQGGVELDILTDWKNQGFAGHSILGYAAVITTNTNEVKQAINLFGGSYTGVSLPLSAQGQGIWDVVPDDGSGDTAGGSWGGHCVYIVSYDADGLTCITWGALQKMTWAFWNAYFDEAYGILSPDWLAATGAPNGFNVVQLQQDLAQIN